MTLLADLLAHVPDARDRLRLDFGFLPSIQTVHVRIQPPAWYTDVHVGTIKNVGEQVETDMADDMGRSSPRSGTGTHHIGHEWLNNESCLDRKSGSCCFNT